MLSSKIDDDEMVLIKRDYPWMKKVRAARNVIDYVTAIFVKLHRKFFLKFTLLTVYFTTRDNQLNCISTHQIALITSMTADTRPSSSPHDSSEKASPVSEKAYENLNTSDAQESSSGSPWSASHRTQGDIVNSNPTWSQALKTVKLEDFKTIHQKPCVRDALLTGICVGFGAGGVRATLGGRLFLS